MSKGDEQRWRFSKVAGGVIQVIANLAIKYKVPKHIVIELFGEAYDEARRNASQPQ